MSDTSTCSLYYAAGVMCPQPPPYDLDFAFVYRLPPGASKEVANYCGELFRKGQVKSFCFAESPAASGAESSEVFAKELQEAGVLPESCEGVPYLYPHDHINTYFEAHSFAHFYARMDPKIKPKAVGVIGQPYHLMRGHLSLVSCLTTKEGLGPKDVQVYPLAAPLDSWSALVTHSQGTTKGTKWDILKGETERIERYQAKGDLIPLSQALTWLFHLF